MDETTFRREYEKVSDGLFTYLVRMAGDRELAADALQEAALKAFKARSRFRGESTFRTWIFRIAINTMKNMLAKSGRERRLNRPGDITDGPEPVSGILSPEAALSARQEAVNLASALDLLEEKYRGPFLLKHVEEMSYREIGEALGIGEGNARMRVYRARQALIALLKRD